ncbi:Linoleate 10R-lipoxygenase [Cytospora mali]|uniref:Linoleate 10R-lipoxygenase n=1 Tax=Cytospora mali TaxID=578113 RepID=A0A194V5D6_CYTMA|nr:Linoleate 10R-lipoxygenase [Valsa mali var. pyri (nom. inval.)]
MASPSEPTNGMKGMVETKGTDGTNGTNGDYNFTHLSSSNSKLLENIKPPSGPLPPLAKASRHAPLKANRDGITAAFNQFAQSIHAPQKPLPTQVGDGTYSVRKRETGLRLDLKYIGWKDVKTFVDIIKSKIHGNEPMDDKTMLMERIIQLVAGLPTKSRSRVLLTDQFINELWYSLDHPVLTYIGEQYMYRTADGSYNNPIFPQMGAAGTTYARSVRATIMAPGAPPDPGLIYDSVMRRSSSGYKKHPNNVSSILWYWATIIIHDLFWTDYPDMNKSKTSSYLDLSPLYGSNQKMQNTIRTFHDGKLKPDAYADKRLNGMPPGVSVLLVMFNRFHNHVAEHLALINEGGRFTPPPGPRPGLSGPEPIEVNSSKEDDTKRKIDDAWKKYDEDLFQTARLVTSGLYINITLVDYVRNIVNLNRCDTTWTLDPRAQMGRDSGTEAGAAAGTGNVVSAEFNLCYRWHSCISEKDDKWIQEFYMDLFGKSATEVGVQDLVVGFAKFEKSIPEDPAQRTFGGYHRDPDTGRFNDDELVECITSAIEDCAGAFGARNVPVAMRPVEILGIIQGRKWHVAGLNEFRRHFGLKPYDTFEELNSDPEVASCLKHLYEHPDFVELYPGLVAEEAKKPMVPGVGIAPTYTISRVVLSDAVCLVRGDRYYTTDYSPRGLTNWGFNEVQYDLNTNHGCCFYKLFIRAFPNHFKHNSVYAHYPMVIPAENLRILKSLNRAELFTWERPSRTATSVEVSTYGGASQVLENTDKFNVMWQNGLASPLGSNGSHSTLISNPSSYSGDGFKEAVRRFYKEKTLQLLKTKSYVLAGCTYVDLVRDVGNLVNVHFISHLFSLPLKTAFNSKGIYTEEELYSVLTLVFITVFLDIDPVKTFLLRQAAKTVSEQLCKLIKTNVGAVTGWGPKALFSGGEDRNESVHVHGSNMIKAWSKEGLSTSAIASGQILPSISFMVPNQGMLFAQAVDFYLSPAGKEHLSRIQFLASQEPSQQTDSFLLGYAMEAIRMSGYSGTYREAAVSDAVEEDNGRSIPVRQGARVFVNFASSSKDASRFPNPETINPNRPLESYVHYGLSPHICIGPEVSQVALTEMFRAVFSKRNLRRAPGPQGELKKIPRGDGLTAYLTEDWSSISPVPTSMRVCWDED